MAVAKDLNSYDVDSSGLKRKMKRKKEEEELGGERKKHVWKPKSGSNLIRIIPYPHAELNDPFIEIYSHYKIGGQTIVCPQYNRGDACPICEFLDNELKRRVSKEQFRILMGIKANKRYYSPVIDRKSENVEDVKFWGYGDKVQKQLEAFLDDEDYANMFSPTRGRDLSIKFVPPSEDAEKDGDWGSTTIVVKGKETPIFEEQDKIMELLESIPEIFTFFPISEYKEIMSKFSSYMKGDDNSQKVEKEGEEEEEETSPKKTGGSEKGEKKEKKSVKEGNEDEEEEEGEGKDFEEEIKGMFEDEEEEE